MAVLNQAGNLLTSVTGTGAFVGDDTPTLITPVLGEATATSVAFSPTTGGIVGTTTNDDAGTGFVGQVISSVVESGSEISLTTATPANVTSISLTAGDWDVYGIVWFIPDGSTNITALSASIGTTSATINNEPSDSTSTNQIVVSVSAAAYSNLPLTACRISLASTTSVYLVAQGTFTVSTLGAYGRIMARRVR